MKEGETIIVVWSEIKHAYIDGLPLPVGGSVFYQNRWCGFVKCDAKAEDKGEETPYYVYVSF